MSTRNTIVSAFRMAQRVAPVVAAEAAYGLWLSTGRPKRVHPREQAVIGQATRSTLRVSGQRIAVYTWGSGPEPLLLVHGWQGRAAEFGEIVRELRAPERTIIAFDAPGHGASGGHRPDIRDFAKVIDALGQRHGPLAAIVAHSFGVAAAALAIRGGTAAARLIAIGGVAQLDYLADHFGRMLQLTQRTVAALRSRIERRRFRDVPDVWLTLSATASPLPPDVPILVVHDTDDRVVEVEQGHALAAAHPLSATMLVTSGLGHHRILRDDEVLDAIGSFVRAPATADL